MPILPLQQDVVYPEYDGQPMAETMLHVSELADLYFALKAHYYQSPNTLIGINFFLYYVEGDPESVVIPDLAVFQDARENPQRRIYKLWEEGRLPSLVIEITSKSTLREDLGKKRTVYEQLGVEDYFLYDLLKEYLDPPLQGFHRVNGRFQEIPLDADGFLLSQATGLKLGIEGGRLRLINAATGTPLWMPDAEAAARRALEDEVARLRHELERQKNPR